ncbi:MAG: multifunctional oxoglutarate decarboxylase/oxoglutarate dehydrogenase thiamine pyrophosphate-binding subunit/dihydrolipoyllysine-residue succinyltransferase subunit [Actinomycetota bacterium]|nr:multifunctional oxoglutarate decarboxylase/oxoglutarate dehydrogenase thiamine pyrophosphate-binding subunit/dihydrolipoyllysine-residue succinyltransferase subunit [Actinomycetota bacterium]
MADQQSTHQFGTNSWIVDEMYRQYLANPDSVAESWQEFFADYTPSYDNLRLPSESPPATAEEPSGPPKVEASPQPAAEAVESGNGRVPEDAKPLRGGAAALAENMNDSRSMPTATSIRVVPAKLLEVNRRIVNNQLGRTRGGKVSFTHLIGWAIVKAVGQMPVMAASYHEADGRPMVRRPDHFNLGLAVDVPRKDGSHTLLVPNISDADTLTFAGFYRAYEELIRRVKANELDAELFAGTTITLTNPGTVGTIGSVPRLMPGQSAIIGTGAIDYPAEYQGADPRTVAQLGVGKVLTITSTYDHRVIQGAESGLFLQVVHQLLLGEHAFYDEIFDSLHIPYEPVRWRRDDHIASAPAGSAAHADKQVAVGRLINAYRVRGHLIANLNPLRHTFTRVHAELDPATYGLTIWDLDREFASGGLAGKSRMTLGAILGVLRDAYCRTVGVEYMHIQEREQKAWIQERVEGVNDRLTVEDQKHILGQLNAAEAFERFLHTKYIGHKRFSLEGAEATIPMLDAVLNAAADNHGVTEAVLGMAHRGRLNVLANILGKGYDKIFREFEGDIDPDSVQGSGDVKYHLGAKGSHTTPQGNEVILTLSANPSHLEAVDPVVEGMARAKLDQLEAGLDNPTVLPLLVHGDAAFAGQGVVAETFALSQLRGYRTGGTVHLVINNQVGFTTGPQQARSSTYATDVAKMVQAPILHVNGDDPEACVRVMRLAMAFRQEFAKDVVVDMVCYRRWGHNEGDDPSYTQPMMYAAIENRRSVRKLFTEELVNRGDLTVEEAEQALDDFRGRLESALKETRDTRGPADIEAGVPELIGVLPPVETGVERGILDRIAEAVTTAPPDFTIHPKLAKQLDKRRAQLANDAVDWALGETLALGSLVLEGTPIRLAGQDSRRGTFSQRHSVLVDYKTGNEWTPLDNLYDENSSEHNEMSSGQARARFTAYDSPLSEFAAMGFDYGYSVSRKDALVLWEAQFGDFVNGAQIVVDQFIVAAEDKWGQTSGLVLLLPHGYEGQGPEHSSARKERFLTLAAEDNIQVTEPSNAAQYFHLLRRQMHRDVRKPLIVLTPKGLLRAKPAASPASAFTQGRFREVLMEDAGPDRDSVKRVALCSGRVAYDLMAARDDKEAPVAVVRVEQLYPWPQDQIREALEHYPNASEVVWVQDEPDNMGAWPFVHQRLQRLLREDYRLTHGARVESASPATGSATIHEQELRQLMAGALGDN